MNKLPVGIQVYGLRDELENSPENFQSVMQKVKDMGYDGVELAGLYGLSKEQVKKALDEVGLVAISAHVPINEMMDDAQKVVDDYSFIGCKYIVVPYLPDELRPGTAGYEKALEIIKNTGEVMKKNSLKLLYHNHDFEFVVLENGKFGLDDIYDRVPADTLMVEPDTCWIKVAGQDPSGYIKKYGNRCEIVHLKDFIKEGKPKNLYELIGTEVAEEEGDTGMFEFRPVGFGQQIWEPILEAAVESGAKWVIVEQDQHYGMGSLEAARRSREYLKILGW